MVTFTVISGPNTGISGNDTTDENGEATFSYQGTGGPGTDVIQACYTEGDASVCSQTVTKVWNASNVELQISLAEPYALNLVGESHTVTATITDLAGAPPPPDSLLVTFTVLSGPNAGISGTNAPNASGQATFTYPGTGGIGTDLIQACIGDDPPVCSNVVEKQWTVEVLDLDPYFATNPVGTEHGVTAIIMDTLGNPVPGVLVTFTVLSGPNAGDSGMGTTNASGEAEFAYSGDGGPGMDVIEACFENANGVEVCTFDDAYKEWTEAPPPLPPQQVPGVTDWGAIVFAVLLLGSAVWMLRRRRNLE